MANIIFYLKSEKLDKNGKVSLLAQITSEYKPYRMKLGKVRKRDWNKKTQRLKLTSLTEKEYEENIRFNVLIDEIEFKAKELFNKTIKEKRKPSEFELTNLLIKPQEEAILKSSSFLDVFSDFIESNKADKAERTIKGYITVKNFLIRFQKGTSFIITWDNIDVKFLDKLKNFTFITLKKELGYYAKITRVIATFLHWAEERSYYNGNIYDKLRVDEPEKEVIFLSMEEIFTLLNYDFKNSRLEKVRDLYCFACFTGLRYSDVISLKREHFNGKLITKTQVKTGDVKTLPLNKFALEILTKYESEKSPLPKISIQNLNAYIKEACKLIASGQPEKTGFNRLVIKKTVIGSESTEEAIPLYDAIKFHTARKTFITNSIMLGVNLKALQDMGAPKKEKDLKKYLKITDAFKSQVMDDSWNLVNTSRF
ncbi:integrase [Tenuifilaceae bacterium CYCD]|nr:integrase [Tenuifilaceae bacterium CYCD]